MKKVAVLMSTYNGEKFPREQIDSILAQKDVEVSLYIRDDMSSDGTVALLQEYTRNNSNIHLNCGKKNLNVGNSFMKLVYSVPDSADYYALSDQDDIWLPDKLSVAIAMLEESGNCLYASNQENVDKDGNSMGLRYQNESIHLLPAEIVSKNMLAGCTMVFPLSFKRLLSDENRRPSSLLLRKRIHDVWIATVASVAGGICYDERSFIQYRQHENNVVGSAKLTVWDDLKRKKDKLCDPSSRNGRSELAAEITAKFGDLLPDDSLVRIMADAAHTKKSALLRHADVLCRYTGENSVALKMKILFGVF